jgi:3-dehydroquinate dehydratase-1
MGSTSQPHDRLRRLFAAGAPCVAVPFDDDVTAADIAAATAAGMDVAEVRIDLFASHETDHVVEVIRRFGDVPTIATIRSAAECGAWNGGDERRLALCQVVAGEVDAIDVEASSATINTGVIEAAHRHGAMAIVSFHDFSATPTESALTGTIADAVALGADIVKIATLVRDTGDLRTLARVLTTDHGVELIVIGMGQAGAASRVLFPFLGSKLTFADAGRSTAPGQLPLEVMTETLSALSPDAAARRD